jgi:hypothetical protein
MTTVHHPSHMGVRWRPNHEWLWIGLSAMLVAFVTIAVVWVATRPDTTVAPVLESASGFAYETEATPIQLASPGITAEYLGNSGELYPAISVLPAATGFAYDHEVTALKVASPGITTEYLGNSGELYPAISVLPAAEGFQYDHEVTPIHAASPGITTEYFGNSGELFAEN